jgi:squalene cyclase
LFTRIIQDEVISQLVDSLEIVIVRDLMTPIPPHVNSVEKTVAPEFFIYADCTCRSAAELMATEGIARLPVVDRTTQRLTSRGKEWIDENVQPDAQWFGNTLVVEHRYAWGLAQGMKDAGLVLA